MKNMLNNSKVSKFIVGGTLVVTLLGGAVSPMVANASSQNTNIRVTLDASRPLIGNPRGTATVTTRNRNSSTIQARMYITNTNGTNTTTNWTSAQLIGPVSGINSGTSRTSARVTGATRRGTMRAQGRNRASGVNNGNWSTALNHTIHWN